METNVRIIENTRWADRLYTLKLYLEDESLFNYQPGQFYMLSMSPYGTDPLLKRPFAPYSINTDEKSMTFIYAVVGKGTNILSTQLKGAALSMAAARGKPFTLQTGKKIAVVAGGVGLSPCHVLAESLVKKGCDVTLYYGARTKELLYPDTVNCEKSFNIELATFDGSYGYKGNVTDLLERDLNASSGFHMCYTCGPIPMMKVVWGVCSSYNLALEVSMETTMGCGVGACCGCMVDTVKNNTESLKRCCTEGPVFNGYEVVW